MMKLQVAVMFGGRACEHEISVISANQAMAALNKEKYDVIPIYISKSQRMYTGNVLLELKNYANLTQLLEKAQEISIVRIENEVVLKPLKTGLFNKQLTKIDLVIPVMHGTNGEDGVAQGYLEMLQVPYAGCDVAAAAIGQDKVLQKACLESNKIAVTPWFWLYESDFEDTKLEVLNKANKLGYPLIIKPANLGSSIGIVIAHNETELVEAIAEAGQYDNKLLVEAVVEDLTEVNCSVLGTSIKQKASVLERVIKEDEILSFKDKYVGNSKGSSKGTKATKSSGSKGMASTTRVVPADISHELSEEIQMMALKTFKILGASGVCRIDFLIDNKNNKAYVNEINTIPGSLSFYLWEATDLRFDQLMDELVEIAIDSERRKSKRIYSFDTNILESYAKQ